MKFDVKKAEDLLYASKFHIQDHDNRFQFYGIFKSVNPDELTFYIMDRAYGSISRGTYTFPVGSNFTMHKMRLDEDNKEWVFTPNTIDWEDITEKDESNEEEEDMKLDSWKDCVIKDNAWVVNGQIKKGYTIYRIKTDTIDIKGKMTIDNTTHGMMYVEFTNSDGSLDNINIKITPDMRVFKTESPDDSGILVQHQKAKFNPELRVGKLYHVANSNTGIQYMMHVKSITDNAIEVHIINTVKELNNTSSLTVTGKAFDIQELLEYKFKEI